MNEQQRQAVLEQLRGADGRYRIRDTVAVTEFRGQLGEDIPDIATLEIVDLDALMEGDPADSPFFVVMKIAQSGVISGNNIYYGEAEADAIVQAVLDKRPTGGRGHLKWDETDSALPANPLHWVGATRRGEFGWGKAYVAPGATRDWLRRLGATRSEVATSIFGFADELFWDEEREAFRMRGFQLEYIDLASPERAGVPSLAGQVEITSEMTGAGRGAALDDKDQPEDNGMDKLEIIRLMTAEDVKLLPDAVVQAVIAQSEQAKALAGMQQVVGELRKALGLDDAANVVEHVRGLVQQIAEQRQIAVDAKISELINDPETGVRVDTVRPIVRDLVQAQQPETPDAAEQAFEQVMAREHVKALLKAGLREMGPNQRRPADPDAPDAVDHYFPVTGEQA
jgi:hypothetical protein